jgi:DNA-binding GntR family transcriptional regulator
MQFLKSTKSENDSLTERVYSEFRHKIITGAIPGGTRLVETTLAAKMKVSRTPVREALHKLALEGLLYSIPRAGYIVEEMSDYDIQDLLKTRTAIEQIVAKWAIEKITSEELKLLEINLQKTEEVIKSGETKMMMALDNEFHQIIYKAARSKTLYKICQTLSDHTYKFRLACIHIPDIASRAKEGHREIYEAIRARDSERAQKAVEEHLIIVRKDILGHLEKLRQDSLVTDTVGY